MEVKDNALEYVLDYFIHQQGHILMRMQMNRQDTRIRNEVLAIARDQFALLKIEKKDIERYLGEFEKYVWGYYILNELIDARTISDIKCYAYDHIRIKKNGKRQDAEVKFRNEEDFRRFVSMVATKNEINVSNVNAIQRFADYTSNPDFILRFNISTAWLNMSDVPFIHIRKTPKKKKSVAELVRRRFMTAEQAEYLCDKARNASGMYFTGKGGAGKTTLINALLEVIPPDKSVGVMQEEDELFSSTHPDMLFQHVREVQGEGKIQYDMERLARNGLKLDLDYYILSEITGCEAAAFSIASYTGHICWASGHGQNPRDGLMKLADYVKLATGHDYNDCLKMLTGIEVCVFLKDWQVHSIEEVTGYDAVNGSLIMRKVELPGPAGPPLEEEEGIGDDE